MPIINTIAATYTNPFINQAAILKIIAKSHAPITIAAITKSN